MEAYQIELSKVARKIYIKLPEHLRKLIYEKLLRVAESPYGSHHNAKRLQGTNNCYRLRVGDWRILYRIHNETLIIEVVTLGHRKEVYQ